MKEEGFFWWAWRIIVMVVFIAGVIVFASTDSGPECTQDTVVYERGIGALKDRESLHGVFVFGTGSIQTVTKYKYRELLPDGGSIIKEPFINEAIVYEDSPHEDEGVVIKRTIACSNRSWDPCHEICGYFSDSVTNNTWYELHVPTGTFITDFKIDLE